MPLKAEDIQVGKCYKTKGPDRYYVVSITRGIVTFQEWTDQNKKYGLRTNTGIDAFADGVYKVIPCPEQG